ncbi:MAG: alpha/beta fold hydrolase [Balneolaceae bacterium]|nr:MAG: alpha/beta fold hydrolase [Balneolaceae bacterium]
MSYSSVLKKRGEIASSEGLPVRYDLLTPSAMSGTAVPVILFIHGFKGFKDWGAFPDACDELARAGFAVAAINLSLNGTGEELTEFSRPDLFRRQTLTQDLEDIGSVIEAIKRKEIFADKVLLDTDRMGILGHSRGGHTAVAAAAEYAEIHCLVTWAAVADYNSRWSAQMITDWEEKGTTEIINSRTGEVLLLDRITYDDSMQNASRLMAIRRVKELYIPSMFIAGKNDESVPALDSERLYRESPAEEKEIRLINNAGHTFQVSHPFEEDDFPEAFSEVLDLTEGWFSDHLR